MIYPKIELHVHLEGTVRAGTLLQIARRNGVGLPADSAEGLADLYQYRDFRHFIEVWGLTTCALRTADDFRQVVVDYAAEAASHGAVYLEGIFTPAEPVGRGAAWDEVFEGYCDGAQKARELHGVHVRLAPEIARGYPIETAARGVVLDVTPISNLRTGAVASLAEHPLPELVTAGVSCSVSTDDPAMFGTDLTADYAAAASLGVDPLSCYLAGLRGALCDEPTRDLLRRAGDDADWSAAAVTSPNYLATP